MFKTFTRAFLVAALAASVVGAVPVAAAPSGAGSAVPQPEAVSCVAGHSACPMVITFALGAYTAQRSSRLTGVSDQKWFVLHARANQHLIVWVVGAGATRGTVLFPNGQQDGQPGGEVFDGILPVSGNYRIRVTESPMAGGLERTRHRGRAGGVAAQTGGTAPTSPTKTAGHGCTLYYVNFR